MLEEVFRRETALADWWASGSSKMMQKNLPEGPEVPMLLGSLLLPFKLPLLTLTEVWVRKQRRSPGV